MLDVNGVAKFLKMVERVHDKFNRDKIGTKEDREKFYKELENGERNPKHF